MIFMCSMVASETHLSCSLLTAMDQCYLVKIGSDILAQTEVHTVSKSYLMTLFGGSVQR